MATTHKLYGGDVDLIFDEKKHLYFVQDNPIVGVTTVCGVLNKPALVGWAANQGAEFARTFLQPGQSLNEAQIDALCSGIKSAHRKRTTAAADIGTTVHSWAENYAKGVTLDVPENEQAKAAVESFLQWTEIHDVVFEESERKIFSRQHRYAGTVDTIATVDGKRLVIDFKTSTGLWDEMRLQLAAYRFALEEEGFGPFEGRMILRFAKDGSGFYTHDLETAPKAYERDWRGFAACLEAYKVMQEIKRAA
jgi:hypothetical protein